MRTLMTVAVCLLSVASSHPAWAKADLDNGPLHVDFKVQGGEQKKLLASGAMDMEAEEMTNLEVEEPGPEKSKLSIQLYSRIHHDGTVAVWANYEEVETVGDSVSKIRWSPSMQGKRGVPLTAVIQSGKMERTITILVH